MAATNWIKIRSDVMESPQFDKLCCEFRIGAGDLLIILFRVSAWFEMHSEYGQMEEEDASAIDALTNRPGLFESLKVCGWIKSSGGRARLATFCKPSATRKSLGAKLRVVVLSAGKCSACASTDDLVIDHVVPIVRGGTSALENLQALCAPCNRAKGRSTMAEFMAARGAY